MGYDFSNTTNAELRDVLKIGVRGLNPLGELALCHAAKAELARRTEWLKG